MTGLAESGLGALDVAAAPTITGSPGFGTGDSGGNGTDGPTGLSAAVSASAAGDNGRPPIRMEIGRSCAGASRGSGWVVELSEALVGKAGDALAAEADSAGAVAGAVTARFCLEARSTARRVRRRADDGTNMLKRMKGPLEVDGDRYHHELSDFN